MAYRRFGLQHGAPAPAPRPASARQSRYDGDNRSTSPEAGSRILIRGHCQCKRVRFEVDGEILDFGHCHCSICRRLHGAAYATFAGVDRSRFRYLTGETDIRIYASSPRNDRVFCATCGSPILVDPKTEPARLYLSMSAVEGNPPRPAGYHAWVRSKAPWHEINDDLRQFQEWG